MLNHNDDYNDTKNIVLFCIAAASIVLLLFLVVLYMKDASKKTTHVNEKQEVNAVDENIEVGKSNIVSQDLDFWDMFDADKRDSDDAEDSEEISDSDAEINEDSNKKKSSDKKSDRDDKNDENASDNSMNSDRNKDDKDKFDDDKHLKVTGNDGKPAYYDVIEDFPKNKYNLNEYLEIENGVLSYKDDATYTKRGIDLSKHQGTIDFAKAKENGIDFVMLRVASRGYETGNITIDDKFVEYCTGAMTAGLPIGVYMFSQAITDVEAVEEANYAIAASLNYNVTYPVACYLDEVDADHNRTKKLTNQDRTAIVKKFCDTVISYGKKPIICASRDYMISKLDLPELEGYDFWIRNNVEVKENEEGVQELSYSNYPYKYSMWQYSDKGSVEGISGTVNLDFCFVDYAER